GLLVAIALLQMKNKDLIMKLIFALTLLLSAPAAMAAGGLTDVPYNFDAVRMEAADSALTFTTSFAPYYYLLAKANRNTLASVKALESFSGWCVGDAHPQNFGAVML